MIAEPVNVIEPDPEEQVELGESVFAERAVLTVINTDEVVDPQLPLPPLYFTR